MCAGVSSTKSESRMVRDTFTIQCQYCGDFILLEWKNGLLPGDYVLIADWVYHPVCWDALITQYPPDAPSDLDLNEEDWEWLPKM